MVTAVNCNYTESLMIKDEVDFGGLLYALDRN